MKEYNCKICNNDKNNSIYNIKEMMFGTRESFEYMECQNCECIQIVTIPDNISQYYDNESYYSFEKPRRENFIFIFLKKERDKYSVYKKGFLGGFLNIFKQNIPLQSLSLVNNLSSSLSILDVGCGSGRLLKELKQIGFSNLQGVDPFIKETISEDGIIIYKKQFTDIKEKYDLIMFHHSFEHMHNPMDIFIHLEKILTNKGQCIIRIPVSSWAWKEYGINWVQLDAPRHFFIHSVNSIERLAEKSKLKIKKIIYDSNEFQFWGSEQYKKDIPLNSELSYQNNKDSPIFTKEDIKQFKNEAIKLNKGNNGDQAIFIISK